MKEAVFLPKVVRVGYQKRQDTYTGQLAYIIYIDHAKKVRKETSWQSWRNDEITPNDFDNVPTSGFVLNKKVGGDRYGWNPRQTYTRVYDPRGFEFEITIPNLLYILEHSNSIKGKGLEGDFIYGWDGTELLLIPVDAPDYTEMKEYSDSLFANNSFTKKDLVLGATYKTKQNKKLVYLGYYPYFNGGHREENTYKKYFFQSIDKKTNHYFSSLKNKIIECLDETPVTDIAARVVALDHNASFCPVDPSKRKYVLIKRADKLEGYRTVYIEDSGNYYPVRSSYYNRGIEPAWGYYYDNMADHAITRAITEARNNEFMVTKQEDSYHKGTVNIKAMSTKYPFYDAVEYLENGKKLK